MILSIGRRPNRPECSLHHPKSAGYTLIELILLAIIIMILVAISTPRFRRTFSDLELSDAAFNLAKLISFAQEKAVVEGVCYKLILQKDKSKYFLTRQDHKTPDKYIRIKEKAGRLFALPSGIKLKTDKKEIIFYPDGHSDRAVITFLGKRKNLTLNVKGNLGYVKIKEGR